MSISLHSQRSSVLPIKNTSINVPIKQTTTVQKKNAAEGGSVFWATWLVIPPTHTVLSANISHLNGKRLFGEELHIGPTSLNPPIEYQSLPCFVSFSSITRSSFVPCEQKLAWNELSVPTVCPIFLDLSYFIGGQSILLLAKGDYNLSVRTRTPNLNAELDLGFGWKYVKGHICASPIFFPSSVSDFLVDTMTVSLYCIYCIATVHCTRKVVQFVSWLGKGAIIKSVLLHFTASFEGCAVYRGKWFLHYGLFSKAIAFIYKEINLHRDHNFGFNNHVHDLAVV